MMQLLKESGYIENRDSISKETILKHVKRDESVIDLWIRYSEDQRCLPSWYFTGDTVGHLSSTGKSENKIHFDNPAEACAFYIKTMLEQFVSHL